jgi:heat shock protein HslJ
MGSLGNIAQIQKLQVPDWKWCRPWSTADWVIAQRPGRGTIRPMLARLFVLTLAAVALIACEAAPEPDVNGWRAALSADIVGQTFVGDVAPPDAAPPRVPGTHLQLRFGASGYLSARAGCNAIGGFFQLLNGSLETADVSQQIMGCDRARHAQDDWLQAVIESSPRLWVRDEELRIESSAGWLELRQEGGVPKEAVDGTRWLLQEIQLLRDPGVGAGVMPSVELEFFDQGQASFDLGCAPGGSSTHTWGGGLSYGRNSDQTIWLRSAPAEARPLCGAESERLAFTALSAAFAVGQVEGDQLTITGADLRLVFGRWP